MGRQSRSQITAYRSTEEEEKKRRKTKKKRSLICHDMIQYEKVFSATFGLGKKVRKEKGEKEKD